MDYLFNTYFVRLIIPRISDSSGLGPAMAAGDGGGQGGDWRYQLDTFGFIHLRNCLSPTELAEAQDAAQRYIDAAAINPSSLPGLPVPGAGGTAGIFGQDPKDPRRFENGFAFDKALERLATHPSIWPIVLELTGGRPKLVSGTLQVDRADIYAHGLSLHCAREDGGGPSVRVEVRGETLFCDNFVFFPYLDDVHAGDGGIPSHVLQTPTTSGFLSPSCLITAAIPCRASRAPRLA